MLKKKNLLLLEHFELKPEVANDQMEPVKHMFIQMSIIHTSFVSVSLTVSEILRVVCFFKRRLPEIFEMSHRKQNLFLVFLPCVDDLLYSYNQNVTSMLNNQHIFKKIKIRRTFCDDRKLRRMKQNSVNTCPYTGL